MDKFVITGLINAAAILGILGLAVVIVYFSDRTRCTAFYDGHNRCERKSGHKDLHYSHTDYGWHGIVHRTWKTN